MKAGLDAKNYTNAFDFRDIEIMVRGIGQDSTVATLHVQRDMN